MKKLLFVTLLIAALVCLLGVGESSDAKDEDNGQSSSASGEFGVDDLLDKLNLSDIQGILNTLSADGIAVFGFSDISSRIRAVANGEYKNDFNSIVTYILALLGADIFEFLPMLISCIAIVLAYNIVNSVKSKAASEATSKAVYFATGTLTVTLVVGYFAATLVYAVKFISSLKTQINAVAPVLITLMTAAGASSSASVYAPSIAILSSGMTNVVTYLAFPALLMAMVFDIIGSVFDSIKLNKTADFLRSACKWFLGTAFFLFVTVIGVSGITASVSDGISVRAAKFAVSKYVPIIGGYLSQGFDFVMAGNVLIKNALGSSAVVLVILFAVPVISKLAVFTLTLKLTAAIAEPLGGDKFCGILTSISTSSAAMNAVVIAMTFLYILFLSMTIVTGNMAL
ncbi:MAG: stage III sporulation protein AE [Clostridiales bacterium]|nr:stage III sporulation protein AE [Clostridiales bacterium]